MRVSDRFIDIGLKLHIREWPGSKIAFVLLHGLSSNCRTWDMVAEQLAAAGHRVISVDQRGHGLSDKPDEGYDFASIAADLVRLLESVRLDRPILAGQSWGGNVLLEFGARYPGLAQGLAFIDGGFIDLRSRPEATWAKTSLELKPPDLAGTPRQALRERLQQAHPDWNERGFESTLANFETLRDGTVRPWLTLPRHMAILRAMWDQTPAALYPQIIEPVLICVAKDNKNPAWLAVKSKQVQTALTRLPYAQVHWFDDTDHDIHVHRPEALARLLLESLANNR
jgi:pimeloyl-ACP methyl ester carboxylesterase